MVLTGRIAKQEGPFWSADVEAIGAFTQGRSLEDAIDMLASLIKLMVGRDGFEPIIRMQGEADGATVVEITANDPPALAALVEARLDRAKAPH